MGPAWQNPERALPGPFFLNIIQQDTGSKMSGRYKILKTGNEGSSRISLTGMERGVSKAFLSVEKEITNSYSSYY